MKNTVLIFAVMFLFTALTMGGEKESSFLKETMIPQARQVLLRIGQTNNLPSTTNQVQSYKVDFYDNPPGWSANMQLTNGWGFRFLSQGLDTNISVFHAPKKIEERYLKETMIPLARAFLQRIGQINNLPFTTNQVQYYRIDYFRDRPGCTASLRLTNGYSFSYYTETNKTGVYTFRRNIKTYYGLDVGAPKAKIEAIKALNLQNKLSKNSALALGIKYFKQLGHEEGDFHVPEIHQCYWSGGENGRGGKLPYFEITWYRKDVTRKELDNHDSNEMLKAITIEVSGIDSSLISYSKGLLPIGSDF